MKNRFLLPILALLIPGISCTTNNDRESGKETSIDTELPASSSDLISSYISLKNSLVDSDLNAAKDDATELLKAAENVGLSAESLALLSEMARAGELSEIRDAFDPLSQQVYTWAKSANLGNTTLYWQYCPMAKDNQGANWLSMEEEILNPYFGDQMLRCGNVEEVLQ